ncbi:MAG: Ig-like domain-containing protein, partial [Candidatus Sulfotelmatobacter sp.]
SNTITGTATVGSAPIGVAIASLPPAKLQVTQPLSPTLPNVFNFETNNFTVQYPPGTGFSNVNMTVTEVELTQAQFQQRVAGTQFANAACIVYAGAGGNCVDDQVTCSESGSPISCPSEPTPTIAVQTNFSTSQAIVNPGYLTTPIGENSWTNIFVSYSDPTVRAKTTGFSEFVAVDLGTTNSEGAGSLTLLAPLRATDPRVFGAGAGIPITFELTSIANPNKSVTDAIANLTIVMVSNASGMPESTVVLALNNAFVYESGIGYKYEVNTSAYQAGQYVLTIYGNAFAAKQVTFTIKKRVATTCLINSSSNQFSAGQSTTFTATVRVPPSTGTPTGTITFVDSANSDFVLGTTPLVGGTASIKAVLQAPPPRQWIGAVYSGDNNFQSCKSPYIPEDYGNN